jgi:glycosyltransferase involved in cell wall biosynthesis
MHIREAGGPPQHIEPWLTHLAATVDIEVVAPGAGAALGLYDAIAATRALSYRPLSVPQTAPEMLRLMGGLAHETGVFVRHIRKTRPTAILVVTTLLPQVVLAARICRTPAIVYVGEIFEKGYVSGRRRRVAGSMLARFLQSSATALVCCSETIARQFDADATADIPVIYPGVRAGVVPPDPPGPGPHVAMLGNVTRARGQDVALRALARVRRNLPAAHLTLAGATMERPADLAFAVELRALAAELGVADAVDFAGFVDPERLYADAHVVVNPARFNEPLGRVSLEALAAGRPVVSSRVGAVPEVLEDEKDALLVAPDDPDALAAAIERVWTDRALRDRLVANGRTLVQTRFREEAGTEAFGRLVENVLRGANRG